MPAKPKRDIQDDIPLLRREDFHNSAKEDRNVLHRRILRVGF